jgi:Domain of unknown function (DUF4352)
VISVRVRNIGDEQRTFEQSSQYLFDSADRRYETSDTGLYLEDSKSFLEQINPGNGVTAPWSSTSPDLQGRETRAARLGVQWRR